MKRVSATLLTGSIIWFLGFGTIFSFNLWSEYKLFNHNLFELLDYMTANLMLPIGGFLTAIFTAWVMTKEKALYELRAKDVHVFKLWRYSLKYLVPSAVLLIFADFVGMI